MENKKTKKSFEGVVVSDKMTKTIVVVVPKLTRNKKYRTQTYLRRKFKAHDEKQEAKIGDRVRIEETRPISKDKRWQLVAVLEKRSVITESD